MVQLARMKNIAGLGLPSFEVRAMTTERIKLIGRQTRRMGISCPKMFTSKTIRIN